MRNLKKVLALGLATIMLFGMMITGAGALDYSDAGNITPAYTEAVGVMDLIDVINGDEHGFRPGDPISRAEAAAITHRLFATRPNADAFTAYTTAFTDVTVDKWYVSPISWCYQQGIVAGNGDGTFDPEGNVTGYQFAKMILTALGYNAVTEGYVNNPDWEANINIDALTAGYIDYRGVNLSPSGLLEGLRGINLSAPITREQAAQMGFNALNCARVEYEGGSTITTPDGFTMTSGGTLEQAMDMWTYVYGDSLVYGYGDTNSPVSAYSYIYNGEEYFVYDTPVKTYTTKTDEKTIAADLKGYVNGGVVSGLDATTDGKTGTNDAQTHALIADLTGNGVKVEVYVGDVNEFYGDYNEVYAVVVTTTGLVQVSNIATDGTITVTEVAGPTWASINPIEKDEEDPIYNALAAIGKDGYAVVTATTTDNGSTYTITSVTAPQTVHGSVSATTRLNNENVSLTVGALTIPVSKNADSSTVKGAVPSIFPGTFYLDTDGNALYFAADVAAEATMPDVIYVTASEWVTGVDDYGNESFKFRGILPNGDEVVLGMEGGDDPIIDPVGGTEDPALDVNKVYKCEDSDDDGLYELTAADAGTVPALVDRIGVIQATGKTIAKGQVNIVAANDVTYYFASDVKFVYVTAEAGKATVTEVDGVHDISTSGKKLGANDWLIIAKDVDGNYVVQTVYITGAVAEAPDTSNVVYIETAWTTGNHTETRINSKGETEYCFVGYVNGVETPFWTKLSNPGKSAGSFYTVETTNGLFTAESVEAADSGKTGGAVEYQTIVKIGSTYYLTDKRNGIANANATSAVVYDLRTDPDVTITSVDALMKYVNAEYDLGEDVPVAGTTETGLTISYVYSKGAISVIYIEETVATFVPDCTCDPETVVKCTAEAKNESCEYCRWDGADLDKCKGAVCTDCEEACADATAAAEVECKACEIAFADNDNGDAIDESEICQGCNCIAPCDVSDPENFTPPDPACPVCTDATKAENCKGTE